MNAIATDEENVIMLKAWWHKNRSWLLTAIIVIVVGVVGFKYYAHKQLNTAQSASLLFTEFFGAHEEGNAELAASLAAELQKDYAHTPYANAIALILAKDAVDKSDLQQASTQLTWIIEKGSPYAKEIARIRLSQVKLAQQEPEAALDLLSGIVPDEYQALHEEAKGDALYALQRYDEARTAYMAALQAFTVAGYEPFLLQFKINALPQG